MTNAKRILRAVALATAMTKLWLASVSGRKLVAPLYSTRMM